MNIFSARKFHLVSFMALLWGMLCAFSSVVSAQSNDKWRAGSANSLTLGSTYVLTIFISETEWKYEDKRKLYDRIYEAQDWIKAQSALYNKKVEFVGGQFGLDKTIMLDKIASGTGSGNEPVDWVGKILGKIGYKTPLEFYDWVKKKTKCKNAVVLILANKKGRGYAMPFSNEMEKAKYFVEGCILYNQYEDGQKLLSSSIAHEFLHLFGGWDLYKTFQQTQDREDKARQIYPDDIMLRVAHNINDLKIDKLTAWLVGLNSTEEKIFPWFRPKE